MVLGIGLGIAEGAVELVDGSVGMLSIETSRCVAETSRCVAETSRCVGGLRTSDTIVVTAIVATPTGIRMSVA